MSTPGGTCLVPPTPYAPAIPYSREPSRAPRGKRPSQTDPERARRILAMADELAAKSRGVIEDAAHMELREGWIG